MPSVVTTSFQAWPSFFRRSLAAPFSEALCACTCVTRKAEMSEGASVEGRKCTEGGSRRFVLCTAFIQEGERVKAVLVVGAGALTYGVIVGGPKPSARL